MRQPCACPARHGQHSSADRAQHVRPFSLDRLGVEQRAAACAALSSARLACAFAAFSPSLAWVQALAQNTPPPSQRCLKDAFTSKPQALLATVHVIAGPAPKQRAVRLGLSFAGTPKRLRRNSVFFGRPNHCDFEISSRFASSALSVNSASAVSTPIAFNRAMRPFCSVTIRRASSIWRALECCEDHRALSYRRARRGYI